MNMVGTGVRTELQVKNYLGDMEYTHKIISNPYFEDVRFFPGDKTIYSIAVLVGESEAEGAVVVSWEKSRHTWDNPGVLSMKECSTADLTSGDEATATSFISDEAADQWLRIVASSNPKTNEEDEKSARINDIAVAIENEFLPLFEHEVAEGLVGVKFSKSKKEV